MLCPTSGDVIHDGRTSGLVDDVTPYALSTTSGRTSGLLDDVIHHGRTSGTSGRSSGLADDVTTYGRTSGLVDDVTPYALAASRSYSESRASYSRSSL